MGKLLSCRYVRNGNIALFRNICIYLMLSLLSILILSACNPALSEVSIQPPVIAQPDPTFENPIVIIQPTDQPVPTAAPEPTINIFPTQPPAPDYPPCNQATIGQDTTCMIERSYCSYNAGINGSPTFCNDAPYPSNLFTFLAWGEDLSSYDGKCLIVTGEVKLYKEKPEIIGKESSISLCE